MLVVIALIAILAAIVFPVFSRVRENGRKTACLSNLKQLGQAFRLYSQDHRDKLPYFAPSRANWTYSWHHRLGPFMGNALLNRLTNALQPYVPDARIWFCPSDLFRPEVNAAGQQWGTEQAAMQGYVSYSVCTNWNTYKGGPDPYCPGYFQPTDVVRIIPDPLVANIRVARSPSKVNLLIDNGLYIDPAPKNQGPHMEGSNVLFLDGHVKYVPASKWAELHPPMVPVK